MMYIVSPLAGLSGGILWRPPAYSLSIEGVVNSTFQSPSVALTFDLSALGNISSKSQVYYLLLLVYYYEFHFWNE